MKQVSLSALAMAALIAAAIVWVTALGFYGIFPPVKPYSSVILWLAAVICGVQGLLMRKKLEDNEVGLDRTQVNPMTIAFNAMLGQAVAWIGAILGGAYAGLVLFSLVNGAHLSAAQDDLPGVLIGAIGGGLAAAAGVWLERNCIVPPSDGDSNGFGRGGRRGLPDSPLKPAS